MRPLLLLPFLLLLAACGPDGADASADDAGGDDGTSAVDDGEMTEPTLDDGDAAAAGGPGDGAIVTFLSLTPGDRACYVKVRDEAGGETEEMASFDVCEQPGLEGQRMRITRTMENVQAESCQGNPDCTDSESVSVITAVEPAE